MKDKKRYSEAFKQKVMKELRDGTRKTVLSAIRSELHKAGIGRNRLGTLLKREGLLVERLRVFYCLPHDEAGPVARAVAEPRQGHGLRQTRRPAAFRAATSVTPAYPCGTARQGRNSRLVVKRHNSTTKCQL
ncbi:MAG: hypothetical protein IJU44_04890 [Kiritimatiellae bacterium]|nr:hypothetical protein [Kiritimatiellia bacterium]